MNIEEIMKPYFDKKEEFSKRKENFEAGYDLFINTYNDEIEKWKLENEESEKEMIALKTRLQTIRNNRNSEIEEYVKNAVADRPEFYAGYGVMIRKDLEQEYIKREKALELEIINLSDKINNNYLKIARNNKKIRESEEAKKVGETNKFYNVDVRELVDIKHDLRKLLISAKKELEIKIKEVSLRFEAVMYKLSTFKYQYDENHKVVNGNEYRRLFEESNTLVEVKYNIQAELKKLEEYLNLTELTEEEVKTIMMSMTPWEKEEYDRRKALNTEIDVVSEDLEEVNVEEIIPAEPEVEISEEPVEEVTESVEEVEEPVVEDSQQVVYETAQQAIEEATTLEENYSEFMKEIFKDISAIIKSQKARIIKLENGQYLSAKYADEKNYQVVGDVYLDNEEMQLPNGVYLNKRDISRALDNYRKQNKGRTFTVNGIELEVNRKTVTEVKRALRDCSIVKLLSEKKLGSFDIKRVYGKEKTDEYNKFVNIGSVETKMPTGDYIKLSDFYECLEDLFIEKSSSWLEKLTSKFRKKQKEEVQFEQVQDAEYTQVDEQTETDFNWSADEPEYEVVKGKSR